MGSIEDAYVGFLVRPVAWFLMFVGIEGLQDAGLIHSELTPVMGITIASILLNVPCLYVYKSSVRKARFVGFCVCVDVILVSVVVDYLGGIDPLCVVYVYLGIIVFCHFYLSRSIGHLMAGLAGTCYVFLISLDLAGAAGRKGAMIEMCVLPRWFQIVFVCFNVSAMLLISLCADLIAGRIRKNALAIERTKRALKMKNLRLAERIREKEILADEVLYRTRQLESTSEELEKSLADLQDVKDRLHIKERMSELGKFVADAAHAIKTPLAVLKLRFKSLREKLPEGNTVLGDIGEMEKQVDHLYCLVNNLLNFYGPSKISNRKINLNNLMEITLTLVTERGIVGPGIQVRRHYDRTLPIIEGDFFQLQHAFLNLLVNAVESMPEGGRLTVRTYADDGFVVSDIEDTGCCLEPELAEDIFRPFYTTKQGKNGVGLGLAIAKKVFERHQGYIRVESTKPVGTRFMAGIPGIGKENKVLT